MVTKSAARSRITVDFVSRLLEAMRKQAFAFNDDLVKKCTAIMSKVIANFYLASFQPVPKSQATGRSWSYWSGAQVPKPDQSVNQSTDDGHLLAQFYGELILWAQRKSWSF